MISHPGGVKERIAHPIESSVKHRKIAMRSTTATVPHPPRTRMPATPRRTPRSKVRIALYKNRNGLVNSLNNALINLKLSHLSALFRQEPVLSASPFLFRTGWGHPALRPDFFKGSLHWATCFSNFTKSVSNRFERVFH